MQYELWRDKHGVLWARNEYGLWQHAQPKHLPPQPPPFPWVRLTVDVLGFLALIWFIWHDGLFYTFGMLVTLSPVMIFWACIQGGRQLRAGYCVPPTVVFRDWNRS